ncbi:lysophospholipid acyltransferase family protein [Pelosinus sp. UFO1]|uniref:lysophospholipid acyltransferase family protein n=1 Tax=Pelosinus sp. UFO1 TaxID=484770 RepID=UPI0004D1F9E6|nr:lysophospholipid acyltransferase family protein [Pelosinus sp. UFO1]AIF53755.1 lipid A biosynthesis acyltransferase [Pelosinus sp. UFO1]
MSNVWQYYLLKSISRMVCLLPYSWVLFLGRRLGKLYYHIAARQRRRALEQMQESLGISDEEAQKNIVSLFTKLGQTFLEVLYTPVLKIENVHQYITIENRHYLTEAVEQGRGVVLLTAHIGNWEWLGAALAMNGFPMAAVIKRQPNDQHTRILNEYRELVGIEIFSRGTAELVSAAKALKQGKILGFLADQDAGVNGLFIEFLGKMSSTPTGPTIFAKKFKAPVVPSFIVRSPEGGHRVLIGEPFYYEDTGNVEEDTRNLTVKMTQIIEQTIRQYPDEWLWFQKRWNTAYTQAAVKQEESNGGKERMGKQA